MLCKSCGAPIPEGAKFCPYCGRAVPKPEPLRVDQVVDTVEGALVGIAAEEDVPDAQVKQRVGALKSGGEVVGVTLGDLKARDDSSDKRAKLFAPVYRRIQALRDDPDVDKEEITGILQKIEQEVAKGDTANPRRIARWLQTLALMSPEVLIMTVACLTAPNAGVPAAVREVAEKTQP